MVSENSSVFIYIMVFPFDDNFVFADNFFSWVIIFPRVMNYSLKEKLFTKDKTNYSPTNEVNYPTETPFIPLI